MDTRAPYGYEHILPGKVICLYFTFAENSAVRYADLEMGCSVRSRRSLRLLPKQRVALEIAADQVLVWRPHAEIALSLEASPSHSYHVALHANSRGDGFHVMLLKGPTNWLLVYSSDDLHAPVVSTAYLPDCKPFFAGDSVHIPGTGRVVVLDSRPGNDLSRAPCYYEAIPGGVAHAETGVEIVHARSGSNLHAKEGCIAGSDLIPIYNSPLHNSFWYSGDTEEIAYVIFLDAEPWRVISSLKRKCLELPGFTNALLVQICTDPDNWDLISSLIPQEFRSDAKLGDFITLLSQT